MSSKIPFQFTNNKTWEGIARGAIRNCPNLTRREQEIIALRFGIGNDRQTLQSIGERYQITRERVRQIINSVLKKVSESSKNNSELQSAIKEVEKIVDNNEGYLSSIDLSKIIDNESEANSFRFLAQISKNLNYIKKTQKTFEGWASKNLDQNRIKTISEKAEKALKEKNETLSTQELSKLISEKESAIKAALKASKDIIKDDSGKWGLVSWAHINPKNIREKSVYIFHKHKKPMHYREITEKINDISERRISQQSVHNELIKNPDFVLIGRGIYALRKWGYKPGFVEEIIEEILVEAGEPLHKEIIIERVLEKRIVKPTTISINLKKPKFKKVGKSRYTLN